ncbi:MAG: hypothetical protein Q4E56_03730 [Pseudomonadota bacterium]|nr:hypothetical protein [Pseudomonadota bacterium]
MATKKLDKKVLARVGAGIAAIALLAFGITQCSSKQSARADRDNYKSAYENLNGQVERLTDENAALRDSLDYTAAKLNECEKGKRCVRAQTPAKKKSQPKKSPAKPQQKQSQKSAPASCGGGNKVIVRDDAQNNGAIVVGNNNNVVVVNNNAKQVAADTVKRVHTITATRIWYSKVKAK